MTIDPTILAALGTSEVEALQSRPVLHAEAVLNSGRGASYSLDVYSSRGRPIYTSGWRSINRIPTVVRIAPFEVRGIRVRLTRRLYLSNSPVPVASRSVGVPFTYNTGYINVSFSGTSGPLRKLRTVTYKAKIALQPRVPRPYGRGSSITAIPASLKHFASSDSGSTIWYADRTYNKYYRNLQGTVTPNFFQIKKRRRLPENPVSVVITDTRDNGYTYWSRQGTGWYLQRDAYAPYLGTSETGWYNLEDIAIDPLYNSVVSKLSSKAQGGSQNLAETLATLGQLNRMLINNFLKITRALYQLKRGYFRRAVQLLNTPQRRRIMREEPSASKSLADNWLELQYGWKPLLDDIRFGIEAVSKYNHANWKVMHVSSAGRKSIDKTTELVTNSSERTHTGWQYLRKEKTVKLGVAYGLGSPMVSLLAQSGFLNPISLAWELLPFSFVVDWLLPIGPYLEGLTQWKGLEFVSGYRVDFTKQLEIYMLEYETVDTGYIPPWYQGWEGSLVKETVWFDRTVLTSFPNLRPPSVKNPFSTGHALNALALLKSQFGK